MIMFTLLLIVGLSMVLVSSVVPCHLKLSDFERERRKDAGDDNVRAEVDKYKAQGIVVGLQHIVEALLLVAFTLIALALYSWLIGAVVAVIFVLLSRYLTANRIIRKTVNTMYARIEPSIIRWVLSHNNLLKLIDSQHKESSSVRANSKEELLHIIKASKSVTSENELSRLMSVISFDERVVSEVMTSRSKIKSIKKSEILGPLVLDDLHKTGHDRFPVTDGTIDNIIGILNVHDVLTLDTKRKHTAIVETAMDRHVYYVHESQTLDQALGAFLHTHQSLLIVIDSSSKTVGLISLGDTLQALMGHKTVSKLDIYQDPGEVAKIKQ